MQSPDQVCKHPSAHSAAIFCEELILISSPGLAEQHICTMKCSFKFTSSSKFLEIFCWFSSPYHSRSVIAISAGANKGCHQVVKISKLHPHQSFLRSFVASKVPISLSCMIFDSSVNWCHHLVAEKFIWIPSVITLLLLEQHTSEVCVAHLLGWQCLRVSATIALLGAALCFLLGAATWLLLGAATWLSGRFLRFLHRSRHEGQHRSCLPMPKNNKAKRLTIKIFQVSISIYTVYLYLT